MLLSGRTVCVAVAGLVLSCVLEGGPALETSVQDANLLDRLRRGGVDTWAAVNREQSQEREHLTSFLLEIAADADEQPERRRTAVLLLAENPSQRVTHFLLDHLALHLPQDVHMGDVDSAAEFPCEFALSNMGWAMIPELLAYLRSRRDEETLEHIASVLGSIFGGYRGGIQFCRGMLEAYVEAHQDAELRHNVESLLARYLRDR